MQFVCDRINLANMMVILPKWNTRRYYSVMKKIMYSLIRILSERCGDRGSNSGLARPMTRETAPWFEWSGCDSQTRNSRHASLETFAYLPTYENSREDSYTEKVIVIIDFKVRIFQLKSYLHVEWNLFIFNVTFTIVKFAVVCISN